MRLLGSCRFSSCQGHRPIINRPTCRIAEVDPVSSAVHDSLRFLDMFLFANRQFRPLTTPGHQRTSYTYRLSRSPVDKGLPEKQLCVECFLTLLRRARPAKPFFFFFPFWERWAITHGTSSLLLMSDKLDGSHRDASWHTLKRYLRRESFWHARGETCRFAKRARLYTYLGRYPRRHSGSGTRDVYT